MYMRTLHLGEGRGGGEGGKAQWSACGCVSLSTQVERDLQWPHVI